MQALKKLYHLAALLALLNLIGIAGVLGYLVATGRLTAQNAQAVARILRGETPGEAPTSEPPEKTAEATVGETAPTGDPTAQEMERRNLERVAMEAQHRLLLANRQMVEVERRREELEKRQAEQKQAAIERTEQEAQQSFQKDQEILSLLKPKVALDSLLARPVEEAARLLLALEARAGKKIIEAARKDDRKWAQMLAIQEKMRNLSEEDQAGPGAPAQEGANESR